METTASSFFWRFVLTNNFSGSTLNPLVMQLLVMFFLLLMCGGCYPISCSIIHNKLTGSSEIVPLSGLASLILLATLHLSSGFLDQSYNVAPCQCVCVYTIG